MKHFVLLIALSISACAVVHRTYYAPVDAKFLREGTTCGWVPYAFALIPLDTNVSASFNMAPTAANEISLSVNITLSKGQTVKFEDSALTLEMSDKTIASKLERFKVSVYGRNGRPGYFEYVEPTEVLEGHRNSDLVVSDDPYASNDLFTSRVRFEARPEERVKLHLPPVKVNGRQLTLNTVEFSLVSKTGVEACVQ